MLTRRLTEMQLKWDITGSGGVHAINLCICCEQWKSGSERVCVFSIFPFCLLSFFPPPLLSLLQWFVKDTWDKEHASVANVTCEMRNKANYFESKVCWAWEGKRDTDREREGGRKRRREARRTWRMQENRCKSGEHVSKLYVRMINEQFRVKKRAQQEEGGL